MKLNKKHKFEHQKERLNTWILGEEKGRRKGKELRREKEKDRREGRDRKRRRKK